METITLQSPELKGREVKFRTLGLYDFDKALVLGFKIRAAWQPLFESAKEGEGEEERLLRIQNVLAEKWQDVAASIEEALLLCTELRHEEILLIEPPELIHTVIPMIGEALSLGKLTGALRALLGIFVPPPEKARPVELVKSA